MWLCGKSSIIARQIYTGDGQRKRNNYRVGDLIRRFSVVKTVDRQLRIENKLSPGEVSDIVDKSESHIMQLERGSRNLTVEMLCKFADVYNTDPNTILGISSQRMVVMIDKLKSLPTDTSEQLIGTFISVIDNLGVLAGGGK